MHLAYRHCSARMQRPQPSARTATKAMGKQGLAVTFLAIPGVIVAVLALMDRWHPAGAPSRARVAILDAAGQPLDDLKLRDRDGRDWALLEPGVVELPVELDGTYVVPVEVLTGHHLPGVQLNLRPTAGMPTLTVGARP